MQRTLEKLRRGEHVTLVVLGDSNSALTFHTQGRLNWVGLLEEALLETYGSNTCTVINNSRCGGTFAELLPRIERDASRFEPDLVIFALGINDACADPRDMVEAATACLDHLRDRSGCEVMIRTPNPWVMCHGFQDFVGLSPGQPHRVESIGAVVQHLYELAEAYGCTLVDHFASWCAQRYAYPQPQASANGLWMRMSDAIHANALGHRLFYGELAPHFGLPERFPWEDGFHDPAAPVNAPPAGADQGSDTLGASGGAKKP